MRPAVMDRRLTGAVVLLTSFLLPVVADDQAVSRQDPREAFTAAVEAFEAGEIERSVSAFDEYAAARPGDLPRLWQRGIALYYAGRDEDCVAQFESHRTVNPDDAENSVWHYLCLARWKGSDAARRAFFPARDPRVPMMEVHGLFAGDLTEEQVFAAVTRGEPAAREGRIRSFYAHLYVALWRESKGDREGVVEHLRKALSGGEVGHYMEIVARVHLRLLEESADPLSEK